MGFFSTLIAQKEQSRKISRFQEEFNQYQEFRNRLCEIFSVNTGLLR